jgi:hypothetical protein
MTARLGVPVLVRRRVPGETVKNRTGEQKAMREAKLVGLNQEGDKLILVVAETGEEFAVPVDDRLRAALRGDRARLGQLEIQMESALRPRDIQARIRAGESPEAVAAVAQMPMERVMAFAGPVLAERDHVATLAQRASVRRRGGAGDGPTRNLGAWVTERLRGRQVDPAGADWDAWRRDDGRWAVRVSYHAGEKEHVAMFAYDAPGRYAVPDDDEARWLVGEQAQVTAPQPSERRLTAVVNTFEVAPDHLADSYEAGFEAGFEDAISINRPAARDTPPERGPRRVQSVPPSSPDEEPTLINVGPVDPPAPIRPTVRTVERSTEPPAELPADEPKRRTDATEPQRRPEASPAPAPAARVERPEPEEEALPLETASRVERQAEEPAAVAASAVQEPAEVATEPKKKPARRASKRASVPSWDEIMFGKKAD